MLHARLRLAWLAALAGLAGPAQALILEAAPNRVFTQARADAAFNGTASLTASDVHFAVVEDPGVPGGASASVALLPLAGDPKDQATGSLGLSFTGGTGGAVDSFSFTFSGVVSAVTALAAPGDPASARVSLKGDMRFFLDASYTGIPAGTLIGNLNAAGLRAADAYESFWLSLIDVTSGAVIRLMPGDAGTTLPLIMGHGYQLSATYVMEVPHGVDPAFSLTLGGSATAPAVPEPNAAWLAGLGLVMLAARRRAC